MVYNNGDYYGEYNEWTGAGPTVGVGVPKNVTIQNKSNVGINADRHIGGNLTLNNGTLTTNSHNITFDGALVLPVSSSIVLSGSSTNDLKFSSANFTTGQVLTITGWAGTVNNPGSGGTGGRIFVGTSATLSTNQLAQITINGWPVTQLSTGEIVPVKLSYSYTSVVTNGAWSDVNTWKETTDGGSSWHTPATALPCASSSSVTVAANTTVTVSVPALTPTSDKFFVNGTLELKSGGSVASAPTYSATSLLRYNDTGTRYVKNEWSVFTDTSDDTSSSVPTGVGVGNPAYVEVAQGTVNDTLAYTYDKHHYIAKNLVIKSGATMSFDMKDKHVSTGWATKGLIVGDSIINYGAVSTTTDSHQAYKCGTFVNQSTGTWTLSSLAVGNDMYTPGDFINNSNTFDAVNINGRALILYGSKNPQIIGGTSTQTRYDIDYLIVAKDAGTVVVSQKNLYCSGYANGQAGGGAISVNSGILDLSGRTVQIADNQTNNYSSITTGTTGCLRTNSSTKLYILGNESTKNTGTLRFDQTTPGTTNVIGVLRINRSNSQAELDVANSFIVTDSLRIQQGLLNSTADIQLNSGAVGVMSSTYSTAQLKVNNLVFCKTSTKSAEFYKNGRTLTINGKVRAKVTFDQTGKWHFISFPYTVSNVYKSDGTTAATLGTDYSLGEYDASKRANNVSGWKSSTDNPMTAGKGYIINKKSALEDLYFDGSVTGSDAMFNSSASKTLTYTSSSVCDCDAGWNFIAHPLSASATPTLSGGEFAYSYNASSDTYKLWYYQYNSGYTYGSASLHPFDAFFVKTPNSATVTLSYTAYTNPVSNVKSLVTTSDDVITLNLNANNIQHETFVRILNDATGSYDVMYDAPYSVPMSGSTPRMYSLIGSDMYALNSVPEVSQVPVGVRLPASGSYSFDWIISSPTLPVTLTDNITGVVTDLSTVDNYNFTSDVAGDINDRFVLNVGKKVVTIVADNQMDGVSVSGGDKQIDVKGLSVGDNVLLYDISGRLLTRSRCNNTSIVVPVSQSGVYVLEINRKDTDPMRSKVVVY